MDALPHAYDPKITTLNLFTSTLSLIGCIGLFYSVIKQPVFTVGMKMVIFLNIGDLLFTIANFLTLFSVKRDDICTLEGVLREFSLLFALMWSASISLLSYKSTFLVTGFSPRRYYAISSVICITACLGLSLIPLFGINGYSYGWAGNFCWILNSQDPEDQDIWSSNLAMLIIFQSGPMAIAFMICLWCFLRQLCRLRNLTQDFVKELDVKAFNLFWYPMIFLVVGAPGIIHMWLLYLTGQEVRALAYIHIGLVHSIGLINWFVYGMLNFRGLSTPVNDVNSAIKKGKAKMEERLVEKSSDESPQFGIRQFHLTHPNASIENNESSLMAELVRAHSEIGI